MNEVAPVATKKRFAVNFSPFTSMALSATNFASPSIKSKPYSSIKSIYFC